MSADQAPRPVHVSADRAAAAARVLDYMTADGIRLGLTPAAAAGRARSFVEGLLADPAPPVPDDGNADTD